MSSANDPRRTLDPSVPPEDGVGTDAAHVTGHETVPVAGTTDGFVLAQLALQQRREGDVLGDAQSGALSALRLLSVVEDGEVIEIARRHAEEILESDPGLDAHPALAERVRRLVGSEESEYLFKY